MLVTAVCKCIRAVHAPFDPSVGVFHPGAGAAYWEGVGHFAGTHQDGLLVPVQPGRRNANHVL